MEEKGLINGILHYQQCLEKYVRRKDEARVLYCLSKLYKMPISIQHLEKTGVGRTVNSLRKHTGDIGEAARTLVTKWKEMVSAVTDEKSVKCKSESDESSRRHSDKKKSNCVSDSDTKARSKKIKEEPESDLEEELENQSQASSKSEKGSHESSRRDSDKKRPNFAPYSNIKTYSKKIKEEPNSDLEEKLEDQSQSSSKPGKGIHESSRRDSDKRRSNFTDTKTYSKKIKEEPHSDLEEELENQSSSKAEKGTHESSRSDKKKSNFLHDSDTKTHSKKIKEESDSDLEEELEDHLSQSSSSDENDSRKKKRKRDSSDESHDESGSDKQRKKSQADRDHSRHKRRHDDEIQFKKSDDKSKSSSKRHSDVGKEARKSESSSSSKHQKINSRRLQSDSDEDESAKLKHKSHSSRETDRSSKHKKSDEDGRKSKHKSSRKEEKSPSKKKHKRHSDSEDDNNGIGENSDDEPKVEKKKSKSKKTDKKEKPKHNHKSESRPNKSINIGENGIGSGSGASFAEALGMLVSPSKSTTKKKVAVIHPFPVETRSPSPVDTVSKIPELLSTSKKLPPLDVSVDNLLPEITPNYRPLGLPQNNSHLKKVIADDEMLRAVMHSKISRTKVYSGNKVTWGTVPSLFDICIRVLQDNIDALEYTGGVPFLILKPVIERANPDQLFMLEHHNPYLMEDTDELWQLHCNKYFRSKRREELETWRDMYMRCLDEREAKLLALTANIKQAQDKSLPVRQTKLAYVDSVVKPPRNVLRKQAKHGTSGIGVEKRPAVTPSARLSQLATSGAAGQVAVPNPGARAASSSGTTSTAIVKPKKAPLMQKTLALMKSRIFRR